MTRVSLKNQNELALMRESGRLLASVFAYLEYSGHGIGQAMHEPPQVLHYGKPNSGIVLQEGMTFTIMAGQLLRVTKSSLPNGNTQLPLQPMAMKS